MLRSTDRPQVQISQISNRQKLTCSTASFHSNGWRRIRLFRVDQDIPLPAHGLDLQVLGTDVGQFAAQVAHMHVQAPVQAGIGPVQHGLVQEGFAQGFAGMRPQRHQQAEFGCGEASGIAVVDNVLAVVVQHHFADIGTQRRAAIKCHAPQQGIDPCVQLRQAEGLGR